MELLKSIWKSRLTKVGSGLSLGGGAIVAAFAISDSVKADNREYVNLKMAPLEVKIQDLKEHQKEGQKKILKAIEKISDQMYEHNRNHN